MESQLAIPQRTEPRPIPVKQKAYAFERSLGIPPAEACRRAGGKVENGHATKWERSARVQAWIVYFRSLGHTEEMLAEKRRRLEERLNLAAYGDIFEFAELVDEIAWDGDQEKFAPTGRKTIAIDWERVMASPLRSTITEFMFHKDTGRLTNFKREDAQSAVAQLRDMHGFKAPTNSNVNVNKNDATDWTTAELVAFVAEARSRLGGDRAEGQGEG